MAALENERSRGISQDFQEFLRPPRLEDVAEDLAAIDGLGFRADHREFTLPAEVLKALGVRQVRLLSNNPDKVAALEKAGIKVAERVPCEVSPNPHAEDYLKTKKEKLGHLFSSR